MFDRLFKSEHQRVAEMLSAYLDGELLPKEQARVEKHLARCADCAQNLHTLRQTVALLGQLPPVAVPRSFVIRPAPAARRPSLFQTRQAYVYLRAATALATILFAVVLAGDAFLTGLAPARVPEMIMREAPVEKEVAVEAGEAPEEVLVTVEVEKEMVVEKPVVTTVVVEKEVAVEKVVESQTAYGATPLPAPAERQGELALTPQPLPTPALAAQGIEMAPATVTPSTSERETLAEAPPRPGEGRIEATAVPTTLPADAVATAEPAFTPTAVADAEVLPSTPLPQEPTAPAAARSGRLGLGLWRVVETGLLSLVLVLAIATLAAKRRQNIG